MTGSEDRKIFDTGICEKRHSKQTLVSIMTKLRASIDNPIITIRGNELKETFFKDVFNEGGCILLSGAEISGESLLSYIKKIGSSNLSSDSISHFFSLVINLIDAITVYIKNRKSYPSLLLSSIYYDEKENKFTILPGDMAKILGSYLPHEIQTLNGFCIPDILKQDIGSEEELAKSVIYLIYLFFLKASDSKIQRSIIYDIRTLVKGIPASIADMVWEVLKGKETITLQKIKEILELNVPFELKETQKVPILRRKGFINFIYRFSYTIIYKWKLILIIAVVAGIFLYTLSDLIYKSRLSDITKGKKPEEVVEMYIKSINELDVETLNSLLYKRAGRDIIKEISSIYVVKRMTEIYGLRWQNPTEVNLNELPEDVKVYGVENVKIKKVSDNESPVFLLSYTKVFSEKGDLDIYNYQEELKLKKIKDRWFIYNISRKIINHKEVKQ